MVESLVKVKAKPKTPPVALNRETRKWLKGTIKNMESDLKDILYKLENDIVAPQNNKRFLVIKVDAILRDIKELQETFQFTLK